MSSEKKIGRSTSSAASRIVSSTLSWLRSGSRGGLRARATMCSTMISVPSTMMPKSSAPRLSRFAGMPVKCMQTKANSSDSGIVIGGQQRRAHAAEEQEQHRDDDHQPFEQRVGDGVQRVVDQIRAVVDRHDPHAGRQAGRVQLVDRFVDAVQHLAGVLAAAHQDDALDADRSCRRCAKMPVRGADPMCTRADVPHEHRHAVGRRDDDVLDVARPTESGRRRARRGPAAVVEQRAAGVLVVRVDGLGDVANRQVVFASAPPDRLRSGTA